MPVRSRRHPPLRLWAHPPDGPRKKSERQFASTTSARNLDTSAMRPITGSGRTWYEPASAVGVYEAPSPARRGRPAHRSRSPHPSHYFLGHRSIRLTPGHSYPPSTETAFGPFRDHSVALAPLRPRLPHVTPSRCSRISRSASIPGHKTGNLELSRPTAQPTARHSDRIHHPPCRHRSPIGI